MASDKNIVEIAGNLTRDPIMRTTNSRYSVCNFSIASNCYRKKDNGFEKETSFFDVQCWGNLALDVNNNCQKGTPVEIKGRLKQEHWQYDGQNKSRIVIVAENVDVQRRQERQGNPQTEECPF